MASALPALGWRILLALSLLDPVLELDRRVQHAVQGRRSPPLELVMHAATDVGRPQIVLGLLLAIAIFSGSAGPVTARHAVFALLPTNLIVEGTKRTVNRARPDGERDRSNASFPSSHAANAFALALVLARRWRILAVALYLFAATVAFSRIYLNRHFLSDVVCGAAIGLVCAWVVGGRIAREVYRSRERRARGSEG